jgi:hypothetical protein
VTVIHQGTYVAADNVMFAQNNDYRENIHQLALLVMKKSHRSRSMMREPWGSNHSMFSNNNNNNNNNNNSTIPTKRLPCLYPLPKVFDQIVWIKKFTPSKGPSHWDVSPC